MLIAYIIDGLQLGIIIEEEAQVLVGNVHIGISTKLLVELHGFTSSGESVPVDLRYFKN